MSEPDLALIGVVGAGVMGAGIAQLALEAGHEVIVHDVDGAALERARDRIADGLRRRAIKTVDPAGADDWVAERVGRFRQTDVLEAVGDGADVVIEAALESLELKQTIVRTLDDVADPAAILATNTSALSVAAIAAASSRPERVLGLHFFNPAPVMRLVEVVRPIGRRRRSLLARHVWSNPGGETPVRSADRPGFISTASTGRTRSRRCGPRGGCRDGRAVDDALRAGGFPLGPFELMDLTGLDVTTAAATAIWEGLGRPDRCDPRRSRRSSSQPAVSAVRRARASTAIRTAGGNRLRRVRRSSDRPDGRRDPRRILTAVVAEAPARSRKASRRARTSMPRCDWVPPIRGPFETAG